MIKKILYIIVILCSGGLLQANTISVANLNDSGAGSLRQAITNATDGDVISIDVAGTITLASELPMITKAITIKGNSAGTVVSGNNSCRIFTVQLTTGTVTLSQLNLMNGYSSIGAAAGLYAITGKDGLVKLSCCTFSGCSTTGSEAYGGAIATSADMTLTNCTIYGNTATISGGALATLSNCSITILNCTIYRNAATGSSGTGGLDITGGASVSIQNTILAGNTANAGASYSDLLTSYGGTLTSLGNNLSNTSPFAESTDSTGKDLTTKIKLSTLALNASSGMYVCALQDGSTGINAANNSVAPTLDQCGQSRLGNADIGAFENQTPIVATVTTLAVTNISSTTATGNGTIISLGAPTPTQYGVVWSTAKNPDISLATKTGKGAISSTGNFSSSITGLSPNTTYYMRAYATNAAGTSYGSEVSFTTISLPSITTASASAITETTATLGGDVSFDGGATVDESGIVYSLSSDNTDPKIGGNGVTKVAIGTGTGEFSQEISLLSPNTTYYFNAYAHNSEGYKYGTVKSFVTSATTDVSSGSQDQVTVYGKESKLTIKTNIDGAVSVFDLYGRTVYFGSIQAGESSILVKTGNIYIVKIQTGENVITKKVEVK